MTETMKELSRKMDEVIGRQERTLGLISAQPGVQQGHAQVGGAIQVTGTITRPEVDMVLNNQNIMMSSIREIRSLIGEVHSRVDVIIQNQLKAPTAQIQATGGYDMQGVIAEMRDGLNQVKQGMAHVGQKYVFFKKTQY